MADTNPKRENLLNLALDATERELAQSPQLGTGYDAQEKIWELIVRASSGLGALRQQYPQISVVELLNGYGIVRVPQSFITQFTGRTEIEYIEKPKRLFFAVDQGIRASCIRAVQTGRAPFSGRDVLCALADSGIDWHHPDFRNPDGTTRIVSIWDQTLAIQPQLGLLPPAGYDRGVEFSQEQINRALQSSVPGEAGAETYVEQTADSSGHGTHVNELEHDIKSIGKTGKQQINRP